jgi:hypothetical protein
MLRLAIRQWRGLRFLSSGKASESSREFQERTAREIRFYKRMGLCGIVLMIASTGFAIYASQKQKEVLQLQREQKEKIS